MLNGALRINPWNTEAVAAAFSDALKMGDAERQARRARDMEFVLNNTAAAWAERFVLDLQVRANLISFSRPSIRSITTGSPCTSK